MKKFLLLPFVIVCFFALSNAASAAYIDFASPSFSSAEGLTQFHTTVEGVGLTIYSYYPDSLYGSSDNKISHNPGTAGGIDGIGVNDDEISNGTGDWYGSEYIYILFDEVQFVSHVDITDLFHEGGYWDQDSYKEGYLEQGGYWIREPDGSWASWETFTADATMTPYPNSNGIYQLDVSESILGIWFAGINGKPNFDYSIRGIAVPEPTNMLLLGTGLIGLAGLRRRSTK